VRMQQVVGINVSCDHFRAGVSDEWVFLSN